MALLLHRAAIINGSETAAKCIKMFDISDIAETVAMRKDKFLKTCLIAIQSVKFAVPFQDVNFVVKLFSPIFRVSLLPIFWRIKMCE